MNDECACYNQVIYLDKNSMNTNENICGSGRRMQLFILMSGKCYLNNYNRGNDKYFDYRQVSIIRRALVGNKIGDHSDVVGASPVGAAPTASSFSS